jgi:Holliday junction resolvase
MAKIVTIYLSNEEAKELQEFCNENQCTQYSALKTAVKELLSKPMYLEEEILEKDAEEIQTIEESLQDDVNTKDKLKEDNERSEEDEIQSSKITQSDLIKKFVMSLRNSRN